MDARVHENSDIPIVWKRNGGVQRGLDIGNQIWRIVGRGRISRRERMVVVR